MLADPRSAFPRSPGNDPNHLKAARESSRSDIVRRIARGAIEPRKGVLQRCLLLLSSRLLDAGRAKNAGNILILDRGSQRRTAELRERDADSHSCGERQMLDQGSVDAPKGQIDWVKPCKPNLGSMHVAVGLAAPLRACG